MNDKGAELAFNRESHTHTPNEFRSIESSPLPNPPLDRSIIQATPEADMAPPWFRRVVKNVTDAWFDPKSFEKNPELYEKLGVRTFKKWMPITGDVVHRVFWKRLGLGDFVQPNSIQSLKNYETFTRVYEGIHLTFLGLGCAQLASQVHAGQIDAALLTAGLNTLVNVYPIMVQRYNRSRLYNTIQKMESKQHPDSP
ncbi:MAG: hypothetical protein AB1393_14275 [Candidatus Edwardsbacteria bacterium]